MRGFIKIICLFVLLGISMSGSSKNLKGVSLSEQEMQTVELIINGDKYQLTDVSPNGRVDVYSIIGSKVTSFEIKLGVSDTSIVLPKGYYILKIDDTTRKIAVK